MTDDVRAQHRNAIITGGSGAIGSATVARLRDRGWNVLALARDQPRLQQTATATGAEVAVADVLDVDALNAAVDGFVERHGPLGAAINCVGSILLKPAHLTSDEQWNDVIATNLTSSFHVLRTAAKHMQKSGGGSVVLMSSAAGRTGLPRHEAIAAAKAGIDGMVRSAAATYAKAGIRVNSVAPGLVDTPLAAPLTAHEATLNASRQMHPLGRIGTADEVARVVAWLATDDSSWVTGQVVGVDGGLGTVRAG